MKKQLYKITPSDISMMVEQVINKIVGTKKIRECAAKALHEDFTTDYNTAVDNKFSRGGMWGFEMKNPEGDWEYGDVKFDVNSMTMTCMNVTIQVDHEMTVDQNLEALYDKLLEAGYGNE